MFWASIQENIVQQVSATRASDLDAMFYRGSFDKELANQVKCKNEDFELRHLSFLQAHDAEADVGAGGVEKVASVEFQLFKMQLLSEQTRFQTYVAQLRDWTTQSQQSQRQYHETVHNLRTEAVDDHCSRAYRVVISAATKEVEAQVNLCITEAADVTMKPKEMVYKLYVANLSYLGPAHGACLADMARLICDFLNADSARSACVIIQPNTGIRGAGDSVSACTVAIRAATAMFEDAAWQLEVREFSFLWEESSMYSAMRPLTHNGLICFSNNRNADTQQFRSDFHKSQLYIRQAITAPIPVLPRGDFINPARRSAIGGSSLSTAAELKQHITGAGLWSAVAPPCLPRDRDRRLRHEWNVPAHCSSKAARCCRQHGGAWA
jgi:hypothetical protein